MKTNVLLMGDIGTGKTRSLLTLLPEYEDPHTGAACRGAGLETFIITLEPGLEAVIGGNRCQRGLHYHFVPQVADDWDTFGKYARLAATMQMDALVKMTDPNKARYTQFAEVFAACKDFTCDNCGTSFGDAAEWSEDRALCLDTLTGLSAVAMSAVVGGKPIRTLPEYGYAMAFIEGFMKLFWQSTNCSAICLAHIDRQTDHVSGISRITVETWGDKLAPRLVKIPDEVILSVHERGQYHWSTIAEGTVLKRRRLPESATLAPDFRQIFKS